MLSSGYTNPFIAAVCVGLEGSRRGPRREVAATSRYAFTVGCWLLWMVLEEKVGSARPIFAGMQSV